MEVTAAIRRGAAALGLLSMLGLGSTAAAQTQAPPDQGQRPWIVGVSHYAKWGMLAGSAGFTALAISRHQDADRFFQGLLDFCRGASDQCHTGPDGAYVNSDAERLWQETARLDREARGWLLAGELSLVATGGMFLLDLVSGNSQPHNIPYTPLQVYAQPNRLGVSLPF